MQCLILAGGLGTRMAAYTQSIPKALLPVAGKPFAFWQLERLKTWGVDRVTYSIGYRGDQVREALGDGRRWGLRLDYVDEGDTLRGTGGAVRLAFDEGLVEPICMVLYGDSYLTANIRAAWDFFQARPEPALMTVYKNEGQYDTSNARLENGLVYYDKRAAEQGAGAFDYIDYGLSILRHSAINQLPRGERCDLATLFNSLSQQKQLVGYEVKERFFEVGSLQGLRELEAHLQAALRGES